MPPSLHVGLGEGGGGSDDLWSVTYSSKRKGGCFSVYYSLTSMNASRSALSSRFDLKFLLIAF